MTHPVLDVLLSDTRAVVERMLTQPAATPEALRAALLEFDTAIATFKNRELVDIETAQRLSVGCKALLAAVDERSESYFLAQIAVRYVVLDGDADGDTDGPFGFDDDVEVFNAIAEHLGHHHVVLT